MRTKRLVVVATVVALAVLAAGAAGWWFWRHDASGRRSTAWTWLFNCPEALQLVERPTSDDSARAVLPRVSCRRSQQGEACTGAVHLKDGARGSLRLELDEAGRTRRVTLELGDRSIDLGRCNADDLQRRCDAGETVACFQLSEWYAQGTLLPRNEELARILAATGCLTDEADCHTYLPRELRGHARDLERLAHVGAACRRDDADACRKVAAMLHEGRGVAPQPAAARRFLERAAQLEGAGGRDAAAR